jgi:hypothetical protein
MLPFTSPRSTFNEVNSEFETKPCQIAYCTIIINTTNYQCAVAVTNVLSRVLKTVPVV